MMRHATVRPGAVPLSKAVLTIDDTTAHITASADLTDELLAWFHGKNIGCTRRGEGIGGLDVIDFGDPSPAEEQCIRAAFAAWWGRNS